MRTHHDKDSSIMARKNSEILNPANWHFESLAALQARYPQALERLWRPQDVPGTSPQQVFCLRHDERPWRLVICRRVDRKDSALEHLAFTAYTPDTPGAALTPDAKIELATTLFSAITGIRKIEAITAIAPTGAVTAQLLPSTPQPRSRPLSNN